MIKLLSYLFSLTLSCLISQNSNAQIKFDLKKTFPKLQIAPKSFYNLGTPVEATSNHVFKAKKIGSSELFDNYLLPLDNMICIVPNTNNQNHIRVYNPLTNSFIYPSTMLNPFPKMPIFE